MKTLGQHLLILGGFYFIISFLLNLGNGSFFDILNIIALVAFVIMFWLLCFRKGFMFFSRFRERFLKTTNYLLALGVLGYFSIIFVIIPGAIYGYNAALAQYHGNEFYSVLPHYLYYISFVYWGILILALIWATYMSFIRPYQNQKNKQFERGAEE